MWSVVCFRQIGQSHPPSSSSPASAAAPATSSLLSTSLATQSRNAILVSYRQVRLFGAFFVFKHLICVIAAGPVVDDVVTTATVH